MDDKAKKNAPYTQIATNIKLRAEAGAKAAKEKEHSWAETEEGIQVILKEVVGRFNNREMSLVVTKLQEASHWVNEKNRSQVVAKLTEAKNWAGEYIKTLQ